MFGWEYPPLHLGGLGVACQGLVKGLLRNNTKVTLVLPHAGDDHGGEIDVRSPREDLLSSVHVKSFLSPYQGWDEYSQKLRMHGDPQIAHIYGSDMGEAVHLFAETSVALTADLHPDVIHCHDWMTYPAGIRAKKHHNTPLVTHIHATELDRTHYSPNEWIYAREREGFMASDRIIAVSNYTKNILTKEYGISSDKISVVHNGCSEEMKHTERITSHHGKHHPLVLFLGRIVLQKGPMQFLDMAGKVHHLRPDVQFIMAGDGPMLPELMHEACARGLGDSVAFAGRVTQREANALYRNASCFVMPSLSEPFGLVALEAIAHGTPVILSKQSGAREVIAHCFEVDFWDTERMADCVLTILREEPLANQLRAEAPRILQELTWHRQASHVKAIYETLIHS